MSIRYPGSRFARVLENVTGWVEDVVDSTPFDRIDTNRFSRCRFVMPEIDLRDSEKYSIPVLYRAGLKMFSIRSDRHESFLLISFIMAEVDWRESLIT